MKDVSLEYVQSDVLIIGAGLAGLRAAYEAAKMDCSVTIASKGPRCTSEVSGFNAPMAKNDSAALFFTDIQQSGCTINNPELGKTLASSMIGEVNMLEQMGVSFQKDLKDQYDLLRPLGCSVPRLVHVGTETGALAEHCMLKALQDYPVKWEEPVTIISLLEENGTVFGAIGYHSNSESLTVYEAKAVIIASGGCSGMFTMSTYPPSICGDSSALALGVGAKLIDMEFVDVEPCCLVEPTALRGHGISSTMLFCGGVLRNVHGEDIIKKHFHNLSEVNKSRLAKAMYQEIQEGNGSPHGGIFYDLRQIPREILTQHESSLQLLNDNGIDLGKMVIEVAPARHTALGGILIDKKGASSIRGLFAAGEAVGGLHGANRIGGNAGAAVFSFGGIAGHSAAIFARSCCAGNTNIKVLAETELMRLIDEMRCGHLGYDGTGNIVNGMRDIITKGLPLVGNKQAITLMKEELDRYFTSIHFSKENIKNISMYAQLRNMRYAALAIAAASELRQESRGVFVRSDYPEVDKKLDYTNTITVKTGDAISCTLQKNNTILEVD